jgi:hypothetical protein
LTTSFPRCETATAHPGVEGVAQPKTLSTSPVLSCASAGVPSRKAAAANDKRRERQLFLLGSFALLYFGLFPAQGAEYVFNGPGLGQALTYAGITALACVGYGAVFLLVGLFFRNPIIPALLLYGWEWLNFLLPPLLKKLSVIHYLDSLAPVPTRLGPFAVLAEPTPAWISVPSLLVFTALTLVLAGLHIRRQEISYAGE